MAKGRVNELDLLRFLAALMVVLFHYGFRGYAADRLSVMPYPWLLPAAKYGYLGVALFFLISGFVILMTAAGGSLRSFVISRMVRLYPAFWVCCSLTFATILLIGGERFSASPGQYLINLTLLGGFVGVPAIDGVYWSLFVELKFYVLVALLLLLGMMQRVQALLLLWLLATAVLTALPVGILRALLLTDYAAYFIGGAICYLIWSQGWSRQRGAILLGAWLLAVYQAMAEVAEIEAHYRTGLDGYLVTAIVSLFFLVMSLVALRRSGSFGQRRWLTIGALTYPLYLLHQYIGYMIFNAAYPAINPHLLLWGTLALMLAAAYAIHVLIERPLAARMKAWLNTACDLRLKRSPRAS